MSVLENIKTENDIDLFVDLLKARIKASLPGKEAQLKMASTSRNKELNFNYNGVSRKGSKKTIEVIIMNY